METHPVIELTAEPDGAGVRITGPDSARWIELPRGSGSRRFVFHLTDRTGGRHVRFHQDRDKILDAQDGTRDCPSPMIGNRSGQLVGVHRNDDMEVEFTNNNSNRGMLEIGYQLNFECDNQVEPITYDPIYCNGGM